MSPAMSAQVSGLDQLGAALQQLEKELSGPHADEALEAAGRVIADEWARRAPEGEPPHDVHPGAYRRSLEAPGAVRVTREGDVPGVSVAPTELDDLPFDQQPHAYAGVLEYGDADQGPRPTARPAFDAAAPRAVQALTAKLKPVAEGVHK
jgi:hypothetical protein